MNQHSGSLNEECPPAAQVFEEFGQLVGLFGQLMEPFEGVACWRKHVTGQALRVYRLAYFQFVSLCFLCELEDGRAQLPALSASCHDSCSMLNPFLSGTGSFNKYFLI